VERLARVAGQSHLLQTNIACGSYWWLLPGYVTGQAKTSENSQKGPQHDPQK